MKRLGGAALISTLHWFETELLTREDNFVGLMAVNREVLAQAEMPTRTGRIVLDMNPSGRSGYASLPSMRRVIDSWPA